MPDLGKAGSRNVLRCAVRFSLYNCLWLHNKAEYKFERNSGQGRQSRPQFLTGLYPAAVNSIMLLWQRDERINHDLAKIIIRQQSETDK